VKRHPDKPALLYGHSLGGLLVLSYVLRRTPELAGVVVTGPALHSSIEEQPLKKTIVQIMGSILPTVTIQSGLEVSGLSRNSEVVEAYRNDPLVHGVVTLGWCKAMLPALAWTNEQAERFSLPLLIMHGTQDRLNFIDGSQAFANRVPDCQLKLWEGCYHEIHNEPEQEQVFAYLLEWLDSILARQS
jgi:alpha-beta hydrolase superfamily lysophospholipase